MRRTKYPRYTWFYYTFLSSSNFKSVEKKKVFKLSFKNNNNTLHVSSMLRIIIIKFTNFFSNWRFLLTLFPPPPLLPSIVGVSNFGLNCPAPSSSGRMIARKQFHFEKCEQNVTISSHATLFQWRKLRKKASMFCKWKDFFPWMWNGLRLRWTFYPHYLTVKWQNFENEQHLI